MTDLADYLLCHIKLELPGNCERAQGSPDRISHASHQRSRGVIAVRERSRKQSKVFFEDEYRVTHHVHVVLLVLLTYKQKLCFITCSLHKMATFVLMSTEPSEKRDMSPCIYYMEMLDVIKHSCHSVAHVVSGYER